MLNKIITIEDRLHCTTASMTTSVTKIRIPRLQYITLCEDVYMWITMAKTIAMNGLHGY